MFAVCSASHSAPAPCPLCKQTVDIYGDHALCCKKSGDMITRHNRVRNLIVQFADMGLLAPEMEKLGILALLIGQGGGPEMCHSRAGLPIVDWLLMWR